MGIIFRWGGGGAQWAPPFSPFLLLFSFILFFSFLFSPILEPTALGLAHQPSKFGTVWDPMGPNGTQWDPWTELWGAKGA